MDSNGQEDLKQNGKLSLTPTPQGSSPNIGPTSNDIPISGTLFDLTQLTSFAGDSPARTFPLPESGQGSKESDLLFGAKCSDSFAKLSPDGSWLKTSQGFCQVMMDGSLEISSEIWPLRAMMSNGECCLRPGWEPLTLDDESSLWLTPSCTQINERSPESMEKRKKYRESIGRKTVPPGSLAEQVNLSHGQTTPIKTMISTPDCSDRRSMKSKQQGLSNWVKRWPTPRTPSGGRTVRPRVGHDSNLEERVALTNPELIGGQLNPTWVEWLMGFPLGWTALNASETPSSPKSPNG